MATSPSARLFERADLIEAAVCRRLNRGLSRPALRELFVVASRLGDGIAWYVLVLLIPVYAGRRGLRPALLMAVTGLVGVVCYRLLKQRLVRERPYVGCDGIRAGTPPLDRYSFPSGHTLHAVSFTVLASAYFPALAWVLVPFAALVAASRVVLGLHYPSDVLAGGALGAALAAGALALG
ncbi:MAG: phosphatase PAP2 family protein [Proteobacteria bacterium]|nr:phosphatase PAP2 family protein [Pseudomonadota bacterium]